MRTEEPVKPNAQGWYYLEQFIRLERDIAQCHEDLLGALRTGAHALEVGDLEIYARTQIRREQIDERLRRLSALSKAVQPMMMLVDPAWFTTLKIYIATERNPPSEDSKPAE